MVEGMIEDTEGCFTKHCIAGVKWGLERYVRIAYEILEHDLQ